MLRGWAARHPDDGATRPAAAAAEFPIVSFEPQKARAFRRFRLLAVSGAAAIAAVLVWLVSRLFR
jgi:hypothetical protein